MSTKIEWVDQRRSTFAFEKVKEITGKPWKKDFKVFVKDFPMLLLCNSVPYTMAFTFSKSRGTKPSLAHFAVWNLCIEWLNVYFGEADPPISVKLTHPLRGMDLMC